MTALILFSILLFCIWAMDSLKFKHAASPLWLQKFDFWLQTNWFARKKYFLGVRLPAALQDGWHFFKMIMLGAIFIYISPNFYWFVAYSVIWNVVWYFIFDHYYGNY